jgi:hypothetical protein
VSEYVASTPSSVAIDSIRQPMNKDERDEGDVSPEQEAEFLRIIATMSDADLCHYVYLAAGLSKTSEQCVLDFREFWIREFSAQNIFVGARSGRDRPQGQKESLTIKEFSQLFRSLEMLRPAEDYGAIGIDGGDIDYFRDQYRSLKEALMLNGAKRVPRQVEWQCWTMVLSIAWHFVQEFAKEVRHNAFIYAVLLPELKALLQQTDADVTESLQDKLLKTLGLNNLKRSDK